MTTSKSLKSRFAGLLTTLSVLGFAALLPVSASAQSILVTATDPLPSQGTATGFYFDAAGQTYANTEIDLGLFTFSDLTAVNSLNSLVGIQVAIELNDLATKVGYPGNGEVDLTLDGIDTGILLNGYGTGNSGGTLSPYAITGISNSNPYTLNGNATTVAAAILSQFQNGGYSYSIATNVDGSAVDTHTKYADGALAIDIPGLTSGTTSAGQLVVGITLVNPGSVAAQNYASDDSPQQVFLEGGTASLEIANYAIPFEPSQALGLGLIALFIALWFVPQTKDMMKRMLVPSRA